MATNKFLPMATGAGANVITDDVWSGLASRSTGFQAGTAASAQLNKAWRQSSIIAAMIGQFIVDNASVDANDSQGIATITANFESALDAIIASAIAEINLSAYTPESRKLSVSDAMTIGGTAGGTADLSADRSFGLSFASTDMAAAGTDSIRPVNSAGVAAAINALGKSHAPDIILYEQYSAGTPGVDATAGSWNKRNLNTVARNTIGASLSSGVITLPAGTYYAEFNALALSCNFHVASIRDTSGNIKVNGSSTFGYASTTGTNTSVGAGIFALPSGGNLRLDHYTTLAGCLGVSSGYVSSVIPCIYSNANFWKVA